MTLREELERTGNWLFKWRSYMPLLMIFLVFLAAFEFKYPGESHKMDHIWEMICLAVSFVGLIIRITTVGYVPGCTSVRETKEQVAETLNTTGIYSIVRHPLYLGNFIIWFGLSLILFKWWFTLIVCLVCWVYYE